MFDDEIQTGIMASIANRSFYKVAKFPTRNITTSIVLVYGGEDSLVDINVMLKELPPHTVAKEVSHFEHLDFLWGQDVEKLVFPHVLDALDQYSMAPEPEEAEKPEPTAPIEEEPEETNPEEEEPEETSQEKVTENLLDELLLAKPETHLELDVDAQADEVNQADEEDNAQEDEEDNVQVDEEVAAIVAEIPEVAVPERESTFKPVCESVFEPILETLESEEEGEEESVPQPREDEEEEEEEQKEKELETPQPEEEKELELVPQSREDEDEEEEDSVPPTGEEQELESATQLVSDSVLESVLEPTEPNAEPVFETPEAVLEPPSPERVYEAIETAIATLPTQPLPSPPIVTTREQAPVDVHITPLQPSALEPSGFSVTPPTGPASSRSSSRQRPGRNGYSSPSSSYDRAARSRSPLAYGPIPTGLLHTPPRGPSAQNRTSPKVALSYGDRPITPMTATTNQNMTRSGSLGSASGSSVSNGGIQVGSSQVTTAVSDAVSENAGLIPDASRSFRTTTPPPAPAATAVFSPPTAPRALLSPPIGPKNPLQRQRRHTSTGPNGINSDGRNSHPHHSIEDPSRGGKNRRRGRGRGRGSSAPGSPVGSPRNRMMSPPPMMPLDGMGGMGGMGGMSTYGMVPTYGGMVPFGAGSPPPMSPPPMGYRGHGEVRMGMEASLHSDRMNTHSGW
jgi:hypothetical protein